MLLLEYKILYDIMYCTQLWLCLEVIFLCTASLQTDWEELALIFGHILHTSKEPLKFPAFPSTSFRASKPGVTDFLLAYQNSIVNPAGPLPVALKANGTKKAKTKSKFSTRMFCYMSCLHKLLEQGRLQKTKQKPTNKTNKTPLYQ